MNKYKTKLFIEDLLIFPNEKLNNLYDLLDEVRDDLYEADELENCPKSIEKNIQELIEIINLLKDHIELKKEKDSRLSDLEKLYLKLRISN
jgi:hypothetical protein